MGYSQESLKVTEALSNKLIQFLKKKQVRQIIKNHNEQDIDNAANAYSVTAK